MFTWGHCSVLLFLTSVAAAASSDKQRTAEKSKDAEQQLVSVQLSSVLFCSVVAKTSAVFCRLRWPVYFFFYVVLLLLAHTCHSIAESAGHCLLSVTSTVC